MNDPHSWYPFSAFKFFLIIFRIHFTKELSAIIMIKNELGGRPVRLKVNWCQKSAKALCRKHYGVHLFCQRDTTQKFPPPFRFRLRRKLHSGGNFFASNRDPLRWAHGWGAALRAAVSGLRPGFLGTPGRERLSAKSRGGFVEGRFGEWLLPFSKAA